MVEKQYYEDEFGNEEADREEIFKKPGWAMEMPYWTVSAILHIFVIVRSGHRPFERDPVQVRAGNHREFAAVCLCRALGIA